MNRRSMATCLVSLHQTPQAERCVIYMHLTTSSRPWVSAGILPVGLSSSPFGGGLFGTTGTTGTTSWAVTARSSALCEPEPVREADQARPVRRPSGDRVEKRHGY